MNWAGRHAQLIEVSNDKGPYKLVRAQSEGHEFTALIIEPTGVQSSPLKDSQLLILGINDDTGQAVAIALPPPAQRVDGQKEGEATYQNHKRGQNIKLDDDGNVTVTAKKDHIVKSSSDTRINTGGTCFINC